MVINNTFLDDNLPDTLNNISEKQIKEGLFNER